MSDAARTYDPRRFQTTVPYYSRYRLGYPQRLIARVIDIVGLKPGDNVMDLGCGPGTLAVPFADAGMRVTGVDPEPEMLEAARQAAREAGVDIALKQGSSFDLPKDIGPFKLVTMGRSFHWMDRSATLLALDPLVTDDGGVALFDDEHVRTVENLWRAKLRDLGDRYGRLESPNVAAENRSDYRRHESLLMDSAFPVLDGASVFIKREVTAEDVVGIAFSLSTSSPAKLGARKDQFESELRAELAALSPDGRFTEIVAMNALVARRR
jgi:SAM-dependent methyltransferase